MYLCEEFYYVICKFQAVFEQMLHQFCSLDEPKIFEFITYFKEHSSTKAQQWAYCYRLHAGINTNMHLERMHKTIKYIYLKGKTVKRLDKAIYAIMKFVKDKLFDRLISHHKGKICSKIRDIRHRHKNALKLIDSTCIVADEGGWSVPSETTYEIYFVEENNTTCRCQLNCIECGICIHRYSCSCVDASIKFNMCKHIHLVAKFRENEISNNAEDITSKFF